MLTTILLCLASAILGRLLIGPGTLTVRLPALALVVASVVICGAFALMYGAGCFLVGGFYGVFNWWFPSVGNLIEDSRDLLNPVITGRWD